MSNRPKSFCLWLFQVLIISVLLLFLLWLILHPSSPNYTIIDFSIDTPTDATSSISFVVGFSNDNKVGAVYYDNITITVYLRDDSVIGTIRLSSFDQGHEKSTLVRGEMINIVVAHYGNLGVGNNNMYQLKVGLVTLVRYRIWWWRSKLHLMDMEGDVILGADGKIKGRKKIVMHKVLKKSKGGRR